MTTPSLSLIASGLAGGALSIWAITHTDSSGTVLAANYFTGGRAHGLHVGDIVISLNTSTDAELLLKVSAISAAGAATFIDLGVVGGDMLAANNLSDVLSVSASVANLGLDDVIAGPASSVNLDFPIFDGTTGKLLKDSGLKLDTDGTLVANVDTRISSQKAVKTYADTKLAKAANFSDVVSASAARANLGIGTVSTLAIDTDGTLAANSDLVVASQKATKTYADTKHSLNYTASGGTLAITVDSKLDELVSVTGWMTTTYDSTADHTSWLLNVIDKVHTQLNGATVGILMPHPLYNISATLDVPYNNIKFIGRGAGTKKSTAALTRDSAATRILFSASATPAEMMIFEPANGAAAWVVGGGLQGIMLDGNNRATYCLRIRTCRNQRYEDLHCFRATNTMLYMSDTPNTVTSGDYSNRDNYFRHVRCNAIGVGGNVAKALYLTGGQAPSPTFNTCVNLFEACQFTAWCNDSVFLGDADTNTFLHTVMGTDTGSFYGLRCLSGANGGPPRHTRLISCQLTDIYMESGQAGDLSPFAMEFIGNSRGNIGGLFTVQAPAGGSARASFIVRDPYQETAYGDDDFNISGWGIGSPANQSVNPSIFHTGNLAPTSATFGTDTTPGATTEGYVCAVQIPCNMTLTGIAILHGSAVAGNIRAYLADSTGTIVKNANNVAAGGAAGYQRCAFASTYSAKGPATYYIVLTSNKADGTYKFRSHNFGNFPTTKLTGLVYNTPPTSFTVPTTFTADVGPVASLY